MGNYLIRRLPAMLVTLFAASILIFLILRLAPGSPAATIAGPDASAEQIHAVEEKLGLNAPLPQQYGTWLIGLVTGNLGVSIINDQPITTLIGSRVESTLLLALAATVLMSLLGITLGVLGGSSRSARLRSYLDAFYSVLLSLPTYVTSVLLLVLFGVLIPVLPISGEATFEDGIGEVLTYLVLPATALAIPHAAVIGRLLQNSMQEAMHEDYVRFGIAKGLSRARILWLHVLRNSMGTAIVAIGIRFSGLLGGAVVVEALFSRNGLGQLMIGSVLSRDYVVVQDLIMLAVAIAVIVQALSEVALASMDPRIRLS
ncbi:ABC transporter permease [Paenarthrobacter sp. 2TAF44]|uniref:ABC transporter permease n=1 Tax=Paenarthrobacter sp. 2TAF44 TaxID=3233018 RepID=UPI003F95A924